MSISLSSLPSVTFCETDSTTIESSIITTYEAISGKTLASGDPVRLFLLAIASIIVQQRTLINNAGKMNLLAYATGSYLDQIGALLNVERTAATYATTTLKFTISVAQTSVLTIASGTRVSVGTLIFATTEDAEIAIGDTTAMVIAQCTTAGTNGNGYLAGQITQIVDTFTYFKAVTNTITSSGGADEESDDDFRTRIQEAPESFSVAGPTGAYEYWAKTAASSISDVAVVSPSAGTVDIRVLMSGGILPTQTILDSVLEICSADDVRPLTDNVTVTAPDTVSYDINLTYYIDTDSSLLASSIQSAVATAITTYTTWQSEVLGRDINPSELIFLIMAAGAKRVVVTSPVYTAVAATSVAQLGTSTITYGGVE
ncbi:MAG: baseplate assembly protein [Firmicutes bacterium]|nr:baseplate assembly protein [Bacillota bacterium]